MERLEREELKNFFENNFDFNDYSYFYHMTSSGTGDMILEEGLLMEEEDIYTTAIKITEKDLENIDSLLESGSGKTDFREEMVLIATLKGEEDFLVKKGYKTSSNWVNSDRPKYVIYPENIIGYIDLEDKYLVINDNCDYINHDGRSI